MKRIKNTDEIINLLIEELATFCDRFPPINKYERKPWEFETDWYICRIFPLRSREENFFARVKKGEAFRIAEDCCCFCGVHSPVAGGHLFCGRLRKDGWYENRQGWICNKEIQICPDCRKRFTTSLDSKKGGEREVYTKQIL